MNDLPARRSTKGERTRAHILEVALSLFLEHGYEATSMRRIAKAAGVSVGNAYYYFASKEHLVQGFYARSNREHLEAVRPLLDSERDFARRLRGVLVSKVETAEKYHSLAGILFTAAADPRSPLNPFSAESAATRDEAVELMREVLVGSKLVLSEEAKAVLPQTLWLYLMSVILYWLHDESAGRRRTRELIDASVPLVVTLAQSFGNPLFAPLQDSLLRTLRCFQVEEGAGPR